MIKHENFYYPQYNHTLSVHKLSQKTIAKKSMSWQGNGLKILTPNQMTNRLPFLLQVHAGTNTQRINNESSQLLYSYIGQRK